MQILQKLQPQTLKGSFEELLETVLSRVLQRNGMYTCVHMTQDQHSPEEKGLISFELRSLLFFQLSPEYLSSLQTKHDRDQVLKNYIRDDIAKEGRRGRGKKAMSLEKLSGKA